MEACTHAAQNERLPLRVVVQVLFFEQARATTSGGGQVTGIPSNIRALLTSNGDSRRPMNASFSTNATGPAEDQWSISGQKSPTSRISTLRMKLAEDDDLDESFADRMGSSSRAKASCLLPGRPKRMFSKLWPISRSSSQRH